MGGVGLACGEAMIAGDGEGGGVSFPPLDARWVGPRGTEKLKENPSRIKNLMLPLDQRGVKQNP